MPLFIMSDLSAEEVIKKRAELRDKLTIQDVITYFKTRPSYLEPDSIDEAIVQYFRLWGEAKSIFEFGCGCGRTLNLLKQKYPGIDAFGIDSNEGPINEGIHSFKLNLKCADHTYLDEMRANTYDFVLTLSVLDHIPPNKLKYIVNRLYSISKQIFLAVEIMESTNAYTWIHDYESLGFRRVRMALKKGKIPYGFYVLQKPQSMIISEVEPR